MNHCIDHVPILLFERLAILNPNFRQVGYLEGFKSLRTNLQRVNFVYKDMKKYNLFPKFVKDAKDDVAATEAREYGNRRFAEGDYQEGVDAYSFSVASAKSKSALALAYANRSACLFKLGLYKDCVVDIDRAIANNYPNELKPKLVNRRTKAEQLQTPSTKNYHEEIPHIPDPDKNPQIHSASNCIKIQTNEEFGRHVVATRDIQIGEVLGVEKPYTCLLTEDRLTHCHFCMELCYNQIPCESCTFAMYCTEDCKQQAQEAYHKYECPILLSLLGCGITHFQLLALKIALLAKEDVADLAELELAEGELYRSDRYKEVHNLITDTEKRSTHDLFRKAVNAAHIYHLVQTHTSFFSGTNKPAKQTFKEVILLQLQTVFLNSLGISENVQYFFGCDYEMFGLGLYPFSSLLNHSCCPNVERSHYGSTVVLRAGNTIKEGQQCFISYGPQYPVPREIRRDFLKRKYFFYCKCRACEEDWDLPNEVAPSMYPLFLDLGMRQVDFFVMELELSTGNVEAATHLLPQLILKLKEVERFEPLGNVSKIKGLIVTCYRTFGNKRRN